ncbi:MAG: hypothetical protein ABIL09_19690, partial [Gemmatimonadota bacterium]
RFGRGARERLLGLNGRLTAMGGERRHPPDAAASARVGELVEDETRAFEDRYPVYLNLDFTVTWRTDRPAWSSVWALQVKNVLGRAQSEGYVYDYRKGRVVDDNMVIVVPVLSYKIEF